MHSILIADSHSLYREALCNYIGESGPHYTIEGVGDQEALRARLEHDAPDLVLIETGLSGWGAQAEHFMQEHGALKIGLILPLHTAHEWSAPVCGVFPKSLSCKAFLAGIEEIFRGRNFFPLPDDSAMAGAAPPHPSGKREFGFTAREREVLSYLVRGMSNKDIARALDLQVVTVKLHVRGLCRKLRATNRTQAALLAKDNGWG